MSGRAIILIDGGYFDHINNYAKDQYGSGVNLVDVSQKVCEQYDLELLRTKYYHSEPFVDDDNPTDHQEERLRSAQSFFDTIDSLERCQFEKKGRVKEEYHTCPECNERFTDQNQKGVDVGIAVDLVEMAADPNAPEAFILISGDEDLKHAVRAAKDNHANVYLGYAYDPSANLYSAQALRDEVDAKFNIVDGFLQDVTL